MTPVFLSDNLGGDNSVPPIGDEEDAGTSAPDDGGTSVPDHGEEDNSAADTPEAAVRTICLSPLKVIYVPSSSSSNSSNSESWVSPAPAAAAAARKKSGLSLSTPLTTKSKRSPSTPALLNGGRKTSSANKIKSSSTGSLASASLHGGGRVTNEEVPAP